MKDESSAFHLGSLDLNAAREALLDPGRGYVVYKGFFSEKEVEHYRGECERFMKTGRSIHARINTDTMPDYIHPRSHDAVQRTFRIYQFFHNRRSPLTDQLLDRSIEARNAIEAPWLANDVYRAERERLQDYIIVTKYVENTGSLPRHNDYQGSVPFPFIQFLVLLSRPTHDYEGGEFVLYTKDGKTLRIQDDLGMQCGDAMLFDKTLFHEVENTRGSEKSTVGRWSVLIGARAPRDPWMTAKKKAILYDARIQRPASKLLRTVRSRVIERNR